LEQSGEASAQRAGPAAGRLASPKSPLEKPAEAREQPSGPLRTLLRSGRPDLRLWVGLILSALSVYLVVRGLSWSDVVDALMSVHMQFVLVAWGLVFVTLAAKMERWRLLFWPHQAALGRGRFFGIMLAGQLVNFAFPGRVGDMVRIYYVGEENSIRRAHALTTIGIEKTIDLIMTLALLAVLLPIMSVPAYLQNSAAGLTVVTAVLTVMLIGLTWWGRGALSWLALPLRLLPRRLSTPLHEQLDMALAGFHALRQGRVVVGVLFWSAIVWATSVATNYYVFRSLGLNLPWVAALFLLLVLMLGTAVPSSPGKIGVFHYLTVLGLVPFAVTKSLALSVSIVLYVLAYSPAVAVGTAFFVRQR